MTESHERRQYETTPLVASNVPSTPARPTKDEAAIASRKLLVLLIASILVLTADFGNYLSIAPQTQVFERIICRNYYPTLNAGPDETICKSEPVQSELALVNGWKDMFDMIPGILLSLPYGVLSDRWGRKPVLLLGLFGAWLAEVWIRMVCFFPDLFPLRLVWLSGAWKVIGGGDMVVSGTAMVMVADLFSEQERLTALFRLNGVVVLSEVLATPVSAYLMTFDPWFPYIHGLAIMTVGFLTALLLPETLEDAKGQFPKSFTGPQSESETELEPRAKTTVLRMVILEVRKFTESTQFIWSDIPVMLSLLVFFVSSISRQSATLLIQYASKKFHWSIARASLLVSLRGCVTLANFFVLMPILSYVVVKCFHLEAKWKDLRLSQGSGLVSILGFLFMFIAGSPVALIFGCVLLSLGSAFSVTCRSFITALVLPDHVGTLYSAAALIQSVGVLVAGPLLAYTFRLGLHLGGTWLGLPFLAAAILFLIAFVAISCIRIKPAGENNGYASQETDPLLPQETFLS